MGNNADENTKNFLEAMGQEDVTKALRELIRRELEEQKPKLTKEDIMKEPNRTKRLQLIRENMHLFK